MVKSSAIAAQTGDEETALGESQPDAAQVAKMKGILAKSPNLPHDPKHPEGLDLDGPKVTIQLKATDGSYTKKDVPMAMRGDYLRAGWSVHNRADDPEFAEEFKVLDEPAEDE